MSRGGRNQKGRKRGRKKILKFEDKGRGLLKNDDKY